MNFKRALLAIAHVVATTFGLIENSRPSTFIIKENLKNYSVMPMEEPLKASIVAVLLAAMPLTIDKPLLCRLKF